MLSPLLPLLMLASIILAAEEPLKVVSLHFQQSNSTKCLDVRGGVFSNGTLVQIYDCNGTQAQRWMMTNGSTQVQVNGTDYCLDSPNQNGTQLTISECKDARRWYYTRDNRLETEFSNDSINIFCADLEMGNTTNSNRVLNRACLVENTNQTWFTNSSFSQNLDLPLLH